MWLCPKPSLPRKVFSSELWDYFPTVLNFNVCLRFKPVSRVFCGVLWPPVYSPQNDLPLLCDISGKSVSRFEQVLLLQAFCAHSGGEKHLIISCRGQSLPDWCPPTDLILPLGMRLTSLHEIHQLPDCRSSASAGMLVLVTWLVLFCCFIPFYSQCWHRRRGKRSEIEQIGEDMNLNSGEHWNWIL